LFSGARAGCTGAAAGSTTALTAWRRTASGTGRRTGATTSASVSPEFPSDSKAGKGERTPAEASGRSRSERSDRSRRAVCRSGGRSGHSQGGGPMARNVYDQAARYVAKLDPASFLRWLLRMASVLFHRWLDTRQLPFPGEADRICDTVACLEDPTTP